MKPEAKEVLVNVAVVGGVLIGCVNAIRLSFALGWFSYGWPEIFLASWPIRLFELALLCPLVSSVAAIEFAAPREAGRPRSTRGSLLCAALAAVGGITAASAAVGLSEHMIDVSIEITAAAAIRHPTAYIATKWYGGVIVSVAVSCWVGWRARSLRFWPKYAA